MKTAVSLPDPVFGEAERLARRLNKSRSELYRDAIVEYIARHDPEVVTELLDRVTAEVGVADDVFVTAAASRTLHRTEW
ncbi:MAG: ribbon-helix-helix protein, CopG family [Candidatus Eremiobacteraeota bacterium]|nr:ribbon-helix-helix protein, CopG family [Candidatus Eremiobacteraeota bacterium]